MFEVDVIAQPFERRVVAQLAEALNAVQSLAVRAEREPTQRELNESVANGVSHELCAAIDVALAAESFAAIDVKFSWARRAGKHPGVRSVEFPREAKQLVHRMAEGLRGSQVIA